MNQGSWRYLKLNDRVWLTEAYREKSSRAIAALLGCSHSCVRYHLHRHGIQLRRVGHPTSAGYWQLKDREWIQAQYQHFSQQELAVQIGCSKTSVRQALRRHGIPARPANVNMRYERVRGQQRLERWI